MRRCFATALLFLLIGLPVFAKQTITLGIGGGATATSADDEMAGIVKHLNSSDSVAVELKVFPNHDEVVAALKAGTIDLAFLGAVKYVEAHYEFGATPIVMEGHATASVIAVPTRSPLKSVAELKGKRVAFGYEDSTSTHLIPLLVLSKHGVKAADVKSSFVGHHQQELVDQTLAGKFDACAVSDMTYRRNKSRLRALVTSDPFPGPPIVARKGLSPAIANELRRLFVSYKPAAEAAGQRFASGSIPVTDGDYNRIRFLCKVLFNKMYQ